MNTDRALLWEFIQNPKPMAMETSPLMEALRARLESYDAGEQRLTMTFKPPQMLRQGAGVIQGGALSMMLDFVLAYSGMATLEKGQSLTTINLATEFLNASGGETLVGEGVVEKSGRSLIFTRGWLKDGPKKVAVAQATQMVIRG